MNMSISKIAHVGCMFSSTPPIIGHNSPQTNTDIVKQGFLRKRKTMTERYFVLREETSPELPARLECYENERSFTEYKQPKKQYVLKTCFAISKKGDAKFSDVIAIFIKKECLCLVAKSEMELNEWLDVLIKHHKLAKTDTPAIDVDFKHVWQVEVLDKGLSTSNNLTGARLVCLTSQSISLYSVDDNSIKTEIYLTEIRDCRHLREFFCLNVGRMAVTGSGQLWMETEDPHIARSMCQSCSRAMSESRRNRTQSFSECLPPQTEPQNRRNTLPNRERTISDGAKGIVHTCQTTWHRPLHSTTSELPCQPILKRQAESVDAVDSGQISMTLQAPTSNWSSDDTLLPSPASPNDYVVIEQPEDLRSCTWMQMCPSKKKDEGPYLSMNRDAQLNLPIQCHTQSRDEYVPMARVDLLTLAKSEKEAISPTGPNLSELLPFAHSSTSPTSPVVDDTSNYMPMDGNSSRLSSAPIPVTDRYNKDNLFEMSPESGSSSFTSGTPSSDQRLNELDHSEIFHVNEVDSIPTPRSVRTSSVGSKPDPSKNRFNSAIISQSWSGTPWYFNKTSITTRSADGNSQTDYIEVDPVAERKPNKVMSFFKSSKSCSKKEKKRSEGDISQKSGIPIPSSNNYDPNYFPMEISHSPRSQNSDGSDGLSNSDNYVQVNGYLPMTPGTGRSSLDGDMYSSLSSCGSRDEYVKINNNSLGKFSSSPLGSHSSNRTRKISTTISPLDSLSSPSEDMCLDISLHSNDSDSSRKKDKRSNKRRSLKEKKRNDPGGSQSDVDQSAEKSKSTFSQITNLFTRKSSQSNQAKTPLSPQSSPIPKSSRASCSPFSSLTRSRSKEGKDARERDANKFESEGYSTDRIKNINLSSPTYEISEQPYKVLIDNTRNVKRLSGVIDSSCSTDEVDGLKRAQSSITSPNEDIALVIANQYTGSSAIDNMPNESLNKEQNMLSKCSSSSSNVDNSYMNIVPGQNIPTSPHRHSSAAWFPPTSQNNYINISPGESLKASIVRHNSSSSNSASPVHLNTSTSDKQRAYMNVSPGSVFDRMSLKQDDDTKLSNLDVAVSQSSRPINKIPDEEEPGDYMLMDGNLKTSPIQTLPVQKPDVPIKLLNTQPINDLKLDKLALSDDITHSSSERSRCHSGPCGNTQSKDCKPETSSDKIGAKEGRASSACSSPVSYSPSTSPTLGSVSSMSSLSEGGLSSASSTCTVVNVGTVRSNQSQPSASSQPRPTQSSNTQKNESITEGANNTKKDESILNYASLDLSSESLPNPGSSPRLVKKSCVTPAITSSEGSEETLNYSQIDFVKSEGLHTTSLERNSERQ